MCPMITKKLLLLGLLSMTASPQSFAFYPHSHHQSQYRNHYHPNTWRNVAVHRWIPYRSHVVIHTRHPHVQFHSH